MGFQLKSAGRLVLLVLALMLASFSQADQKKVFGDYEVHYIGLTSNFLTPEIAKEYDIPRSRSLGYVSISVLKGDGGEPMPVDADVSGSFSNLIGQRKSLNFKRVKEGKSIYFIATFRFDEEEEYKFSIEVQPDQEKKTLDLEFKQRFYNEG